MDMEFAGLKVWILVGPTECADSAAYLSVLSRIADGGPQNRVGLKPRSDRLRWEFNPCLDPSILADDLDLDPTDVEDTMNRLVSLNVDQPIYIANVSGYIAMAFDHGLGDAHIMTETTAALTRRGDPLPTGFLPPVQLPNVASPLSTVARRMLLAGPINVASNILHAFRTKRLQHNRTALEEGLEGCPQTPFAQAKLTYATVFVRTEPNFLQVLRDFRDREHKGSSTAALLFFGIRRGLRKSGISLTDTTSVTMDLRRYLRSGESTLANLSTVARVASPENQTVQNFAANLARARKSTYPAFRTVAATALRPLLSRAAPGTSQGYSETNPKVDLTLTDLSRLLSVQKLRYQEDEQDRVAVVALTPGGRNHLTLAVVPIGNELQVTATYFPDIVPTERLRDGLRYGLSIEAISEAGG